MSKRVAVAALLSLSLFLCGGVMVLTGGTPSDQYVSLEFQAADSEGLCDWTHKTEPTTSVDFTWAIWWKVPTGGCAAWKRLVDFYNSPDSMDVNEIGSPSIVCYNTDDYAIQITDGANTLQKNVFIQGSVPAAGNWTHIVWTYSATQDSDENPGNAGRIRVYVDGVFDDIDTVGTDADWTATDWDVSSIPCVGNIGCGASWDFTIYDWAHWDVEATADQAAGMYGGGIPIDYSVDQGDYDLSGDLEFWYRFGYDDTDIGENYGLDSLSTGFDLMTNNCGGNISAADIMSTWPGE